MFNKWRTFERETKLGKFEIDEFRDFYIVKKKLQHPSQKGFYDPKALVIAKKDRRIPFFPDQDWAYVFGQHTPFFMIDIGVKGKDKSFIKNMKKAVKDGEITIDEVYTVPVAFREVTKGLREVSEKVFHKKDD